MVPAKKFLFEYSFDTPGPVEQPTGGAQRSAEGTATEISGTVDVYCEVDLVRVRALGLAEGREQASAEAAVTTERRVADALAMLGDRLSETIAHRTEAAAQATAEATLVAMAMVRKLVPELYRRNAVGEIELAVAKILDRMLEKPKLNVRVNEFLRDDLSARIDALVEQRGFAGQVTVAADPRIAETDCRIEWIGGGAELKSAALWREFDAIVDRNLGGVAATVADDLNPMETNDASPAVAIATSGGEHSSQVELEPEHG
jgi:flagellar assembly protein FliH